MSSDPNNADARIIPETASVTVNKGTSQETGPVPFKYVSPQFTLVSAAIAPANRAATIAGETLFELDLDGAHTTQLADLKNRFNFWKYLDIHFSLASVGNMANSSGSIQSAYNEDPDAPLPADGQKRLELAVALWDSRQVLAKSAEDFTVDLRPFGALQGEWLYCLPRGDSKAPSQKGKVFIVARGLPTPGDQATFTLTVSGHCSYQGYTIRFPTATMLATAPAVLIPSNPLSAIISDAGNALIIKLSPESSATYGLFEFNQFGTFTVALSTLDDEGEDVALGTVGINWATPSYIDDWPNGGGLALFVPHSFHKSYYGELRANVQPFAPITGRILSEAARVHVYNGIPTSKFATMPSFPAIGSASRARFVRHARTHAGV
jgi:hypothetical protein